MGHDLGAIRVVEIVSKFLLLKLAKILSCAGGGDGISNKPHGLQAATRHGARDPLVRSQVD